jgi:hypothetical protein
MSVDPDRALLQMLDESDTLVYVDAEKGGPNVVNAVYWGYLDVNETDKIIDVPLPYLVYNSSPGYDRDPRFSGSVTGSVLEFTLKGVGEDESQAKWVLAEGRKMLNRRRVEGALIKRTLDNQQVRRDDDYTRPGGDPLFSVLEKYTVPI